jgi:GT2 family glycosyltransferase
VTDVPEEIRALAEERAAARTDKDFARADALRDAIAAAGFSVVDAPDGWRLEPASAEAVSGADPLDLPPTLDVTLQWVCEGWPEDVERAVASFRARTDGCAVQYVVADLTGEDPQRWGDDVDVVSLPRDTGWAAARNAGLRRSAGRVVVALDPSVEATGDVLSPLEAALGDPGVGICGPFGIVTHDLREFERATAPGPCDAVEGYLMAFRREVLGAAGLFDERFAWYRTADIEWSFRVKDAGLRCEVVEVPVRAHEHRMWQQTRPEDRERLSKRNFYRFLDRWRDRWDLVLAGPPSGRAGS